MYSMGWFRDLLMFCNKCSGLWGYCSLLPHMISLNIYFKYLDLFTLLNEKKNVNNTHGNVWDDAKGNVGN